MKINIQHTSVCIALIVGGFFVLFGAVNAAPTDILFTEIMYNPSGADTEMEWVEIFNSGTEEVIIVEGSGNDSWRFNDGSNHTLALAQGSLTIPAGGYAILASDAQTFLDAHAGFTGTVIDTVMSLNNTSDTLKLSSDKGESFFGDTTYENTQGADGDGNSLQFLDGAWIAATETPGVAGQTLPAEEQEEAQEETVQSENSSSGSSASPAGPASGDPTKVKISELLPNPEGDQNREFIEIWNSGNGAVSLEGWKLADAAKVITLQNITLVPGEYYTLYHTATKIALNNTNETVTLYGAGGGVIDAISYGATTKDFSYSRDFASGEFLWTQTPTPGQANIITLPNDPPTPLITYRNNPVVPGEFAAISGSDSTDPDDDALSFLWKIGPTFQASGPHVSYAFRELGPQLVWVSISDGRHTVIATSTIDVADPVDVVSFRISQNRQDAVQIQTPVTSGAQTGQVYITEIFPNPIGIDDGEWIELYNPNEFSVDLNAWMIDDEDGGSRPHTVLERVIAAHSYLLLGKEETNITLNNTSDEVRLFNPHNELVDSVLFDDVQENKSYAKSDDAFWFWSEAITPGAVNAAHAPTSQNNTSELGAYANTYATFATAYDVIDIDLPNIRELEPGTQVRVQGIVAVEPGVLAKTYFYITGSPGIQVYFSKRDWPQLSLGDMVGIIGELTQTGGEARLKVASKEDIVPLYASEPPVPLEVATGEITEAMEGALVLLAGELVQKTGASWFIDDGSGEAKITFQTSAGIQKPAAKAGDWIEAIGLVSETAAGYRVLPRYQDDIRLLDAEEISETAVPQVLGASADAADGMNRFRIPANNGPQKLLMYLLATSATLIAILIILIVRMRAEMQHRLAELEKRN